MFSRKYNSTTFNLLLPLPPTPLKYLFVSALELRMIRETINEAKSASVFHRTQKQKLPSLYFNRFTTERAPSTCTVTSRVDGLWCRTTKRCTPCRIDHRQLSVANIFGQAWNDLFYTREIPTTDLCNSRQSDDIVWLENRKSVRTHTYNHSGSIDWNDYVPG